MKKIFLLVLVLFSFVGTVFADTIYNKDAEVKCKIEGVTDGLITYVLDGNLTSLTRSGENHVFRDYVEARKFLFSTEVIKYTGKVIYADNVKVKIVQNDALITIPRYKVLNIVMFVQ